MSEQADSALSWKLVALIGAVMLPVAAAAATVAPVVAKHYLGGVVNPAPAPVVALRDLIPDETQRAQVAGLFRDWAGAVKLGVVKTTGDYRKGMQLSARLLRELGEYPTLGDEINKQISDQIAQAVGLDDAALTGEKQLALAKVLTDLSEQLR